jgi:hypothetical protein
VLSVVRPGGAIERYALSALERDALVGAVTRAVLASAPRMRADTSVAVSIPASNTFVRSQAVLGAVLYGPAAAALVGDDAATASTAYAVALGAAYGGALAYTHSRVVTRAQSTLARSMSVGTAAAAAGLVSLGEPDDGRVYAGAVLAGGVAGTAIGLRTGLRMTDAEAAASSTAATLGVVVTAGTLGSVGALDESAGRRASTAVGIAALAAGYALGPSYARQRRTVVTAGDSRLLLPAAFSGAALTAAAGFAATEDDHARAAAATLGFVAGALVADRALVRRFDYTEPEAALVGLGTTVGAGVGLSIAAANGAGDSGALLLGGLGATLGLALTAGVVHPASAAGAAPFRAAPPPFRARPARLRLSPTGAALLAVRARGRYPIATVAF